MELLRGVETMSGAIWIIGVLFTIGFIISNPDWSTGSKWEQFCLLLANCILWPVFLGCSLSELLQQKQNWKIEVKSPEKENE
jgi:hypothetical protein